MQYIVVLSIHTTPDIVFSAVYRSSRAQRLAKQRKKARFLRLFRQTGSRKIASWPRRPYSQISQIKNRQFICVICGFPPHGQEVVDKLFFNCQNIPKAALMVRRKPTRPMNESKYPKSLSILLALNLCALLVTLIFSMEDIWDGSSCGDGDTGNRVGAWAYPNRLAQGQGQTAWDARHPRHSDHRTRNHFIMRAGPSRGQVHG